MNNQGTGKKNKARKPELCSTLFNFSSCNLHLEGKQGINLDMASIIVRQFPQISLKKKKKKDLSILRVDKSDINYIEC